jgi:predicted PurR-regulated permease PerM
MGRRARARGDAPPRSAGAPARPARAQRARDRLGPARRILARYLGGAIVLAILVLAGIATLGGTLGPFLVFAVAAVAAGLLQRWAQQRLTGLELTDEDRVLQTLAAGLLLMAVFLALVAAVVLTVA